MTPKDLRILCSKGENQFVEFKQYASEPNQITEEIVGFLNSTGGKLLVGVKDDGEISGLKFADDDLSFLVDYIKNVIKPTFSIESQLIPISAKRSIILFTIYEGKEKPYYTIGAEKKKKQVYFRVDDENISASRELKNILYQKSNPQERTIIYSELEASVLKEIEGYTRRTKAELVEKLNYNSRTISDCLVRLVTSKVLKITPARSGDLFEFIHPS